MAYRRICSKVDARFWGRMVVVAFVLSWLCGRAVPVNASGSPVVRVNPATQSVKLGSIVTGEIIVQDVAGLYGAEIHLTFDPSRVAVQDADLTRAGVQINLGPMLTSGTYFVALNRVDNLKGTIDLALTLLNPTPVVSGTGVLARISFKALATGNSAVRIASVILVDRNGIAINPLRTTKNSYATQDGVISVLPEPVYSNPLVLITPASQEVALGETAAVDVRVQEVVGLDSAQVHLVFDPALITVLDSDPHIADAPIGMGSSCEDGTCYVASNQIDNTKGTIDLTITQLKPTRLTPTAGTLARITFQTHAAGVSPIHITAVTLLDRNGNSLVPAQSRVSAIMAQDGAIAVSAETVPTFLFMMRQIGNAISFH